MLKLDCAAFSSPAPDRDENGDFAIAEGRLGVLLVADGISGRPGARQASQATAQAFFDEVQVRGAEIEGLAEAVKSAHLRVRRIAEQHQELAGMGSTLSAVVLRGSQAMVVHVGDSRIYLLRHERIRQITEDQTLVAELVARGHVSPEAAGRHPLRHVLARAVGTGESVEPDVRAIDLAPGDRLVLATDGVTGVLTPEDLARTAGADSASPDRVCRSLVEQALARGAEDDVTAVAAFVEEN